ncbi:cytochrome o ubiquinol oxidase subunit IV [Bordetella genomosp. 13]|uniref:cytochrome o ubiquinol oxidase subunit IV n=1 Tax=Bordetella genomosp. 13 TaxID=463040 RepID=UPI0011A029A9|nr:cytochrome o ubiquinol oxidase subunit IV [Bordetella genomosp. 13]
MSSHTAAADHHGAHAHGSMKQYVVGFIISILLTFGSFGLVMAGDYPHSVVVPGLIILAVAQLLVQLIFFLHMGRSERDNTLTFIFTIKVIAIIVVGSLWVLHNMNINMMPGM